MQMGEQAEVVVLQLDDVWKSYGHAQAISGVSFDCQRGEFMVILGPSGAGKTTTLKLISGLEIPDRGTIRLAGKVVNTVEPKDRNVAMVFENYALYPHLTVFENIAAPLRAARQSEAVIKQRVHKIAEMLGISSLLNRLPAQLSGGQRQRVSLGRALAKDAVIYLLDEPIAHLDAKLRHEVRGEFKRLQHELRLTMLYVTHDYREALALADRILVLNRGRVEQIGTPQEVYRHPKNTFVATLLGDPPMNLVPGRLRVDGGIAIFSNSHFEIPLPQHIASILVSKATGRDLIVGIRPNDLALDASAHADIVGECYAYEPIGTDAILTAQVGDVLLKVRVSKATKVEIGERVRLRLNPDGFHFFNADGQRLS